MSGIVNLGSNCYASSILQLLASHKFCAQLFYNHVKQGFCKEPIADCLKCTLAKVFSTITQSTNHVVNTDETLSMLRLLNVDFKEQGDPREFLTLITRERIPALQNFFSFSEKTVQRCVKCSNVSCSESQINIYLTVPKTQKIAEAVSDLFDSNFLSDYECTRCKVIGETYQEKVLANVPDYIWVHVTGAVFMKDIDLSLVIKGKTFIILGIVEYKPKSGSNVLNANHYVAWKRFYGGVWVKYDDDKVTMSLSPQRMRPYMLLFRSTSGADFDDSIELDKLLKEQSVANMEKKQKIYYHLLGKMRIQDNKAFYAKDAPNRRKKKATDPDNTVIPLVGDDYQEIRRLLKLQGKEANGNEVENDPNGEDPDKTIENVTEPSLEPDKNFDPEPEKHEPDIHGNEPTAEPSAEPTAEPSAEPTAEPSAEPTAEPSAEPTAEPSADPPDNGNGEPQDPTSPEKVKKHPKKISPDGKRKRRLPDPDKIPKGGKRKKVKKEPVGKRIVKSPKGSTGSKKIKRKTPKGTVPKKKKPDSEKRKKPLKSKIEPVKKNPRKDGRSQRIKKYAKYEISSNTSKKHPSHLMRSEKNIVIKTQPIPGHCKLCPKQYFTHDEAAMQQHYKVVHHKFKVRINNIVYLRCKCSVVPNRGSDGSVRNAHYHCYSCLKPCDKKYQLAIHVIDKHNYDPKCVTSLFSKKKK